MARLKHPPAPAPLHALQVSVLAGLLAATPLAAQPPAAPSEENTATESTPAPGRPSINSTTRPADDLTLPPVIQAMPGDVRLEPPPADRDDMLEVHVTGGQTDWRLPDLGTSLREEEEERDPDQRFEVRFVPLFDPEKDDQTIETPPVVDVLRDVGFIRIFEIGIGGGNKP